MKKLIVAALGLFAWPTAPSHVYGKVIVTTASELADAIRAKESVISIESRITGTANEQLAQKSGVYALERYDDFPEVPEECLRAPEPCLADPALLHVSVPTTFTSSSGALWDVGFLRRRLLVSQNVTLDSLRLRGLAADVQPYIFFFLFSGPASLICTNCTLEHSCAGGDASFFLDSMRLAALSQQNVVASADGMSATGSVTLRAAQEVTSGTVSTQQFVNGTFVCDHSILRGVAIDTTVRPEETCQQAADEGHSYRGTRNTTRSGYTCQRWDATTPVFHNRIPSAFPDAGLVDNYCRNPDNEPEVWCYTVDGPRWEHCGVPVCAAAPAAAAAAAAGAGAGGDAEAPGGVEQVDAGVDAEDSGASGELAAEARGDDDDDDDDGRRAAVLAGVLAAIVALLAAVAAVALLLHRRRRRWSRDALALEESSIATKNMLYGGSRSSRGDDDGSAGGCGGAAAAAKGSALVLETATGTVSGYSGSPESPAVEAAEASDAAAAGGAVERSGSRKARPAPAEELREALAGMEVDTSQLVLHEIVGRGGFGCVYRGTWRGLNVAVKTVTFQERSAGGGAQARAIAEAAITFSLSHPNVIATYFHEIKPLHCAPAGGAVGRAVLADERLQDWKLFLVQEFCEAGSLRHLVDHREFVTAAGRVKLRKCVECLVDIAQGMKYIQSKNVIHGDLTPSNVLVRPRGASTPFASPQASTSPGGVDPSPVPSASALPLAGPPFSNGSAAAAPRAWHMLSGGSGTPPHPGSDGSPATDTAAAASPPHNAQPLRQDAALPWHPDSVPWSGSVWHNPSAEPPRTPGREQGPGRTPSTHSGTSMSQFYSAVESMPPPDSPRRSAAQPGDGGATRTHGAHASQDGGDRESADGAAQPRTEEFAMHIDAAPPEGAADERRGDAAAQDPAQLALTLHQPARTYQASPLSSGAAASPAWDREPWQATAKVSDFGLSMKLDPAAGHISNMRQGTPFYAAPEVRDAGYLSQAADSFSFGVIMWECFHCVPPYHVNRGGCIVRHPSFPDFPRDCPLSFAVLAVSCLSQNPADRPDFAQICGVLADLAAHLRGEGDRATLSAHLTVSQVESYNTAGSPAAAPPASASDAGEAISGILSRTAGDRPVASQSDSDMSFLGACRPHAGHSTSGVMPSMADVIRSVTAGRAADRTHLLAAPPQPLPPLSAGSSVSGSRPRSAGRAHGLYSGSAPTSAGSAPPGSASSWHVVAPHSCQEPIPEEDAEQQAGTTE